MKRVLLVLSLILLGGGLGFLAGEIFYRSPLRMRALALFSEELVRRETLRTAAQDQPVSADEVEREVTLLRSQFADEYAFVQTLSSAGFDETSLRMFVAEHLRARHWIEQQIASELTVALRAIQKFYDSNPSLFAQPQRYRASHIFVAAPDGSLPEVIAGKQSEIQGLSIRLLAGEKFADLAADASEDEATKTRGGDLNFFSAHRMPPEFMSELKKLEVGQMSAPIRSHLGFHLVQVAEIKPPHQMTLDEAQGQIASMLANEQRLAAVARLTRRLSAR